MEWGTPSFDEIKMDAEIGSYQEDAGPPREPGEDRTEAGADETF